MQHHLDVAGFLRPATGGWQLAAGNRPSDAGIRLPRYFIRQLKSIKLKSPLLAILKVDLLVQSQKQVSSSQRTEPKSQ